MINKLIADYLQNNKRLVVPTFGAFIRKDEDDSVVFVSFLKKDDGVLNQLIAKAYGISETEASTVIEEYALYAKQQILTTGSYVMERLGILRSDANGIDYLSYNASQGGGESVLQQKITTTVTPVVPSVVQAKPIVPMPVSATNTATEQVQPIRTAPQKPVLPPTPVQRPAPERAEAQPPQPPQPTARPIASPRQAERSVQPMPSRPVESRPTAPRRAGVNQAKKADTFMVIAILAAIVAIAALMYGVFFTSTPKIELGSLPAVDTVEQVQQSAQ